MKVLIATDGTLDPQDAARFAARLAGDDPVTVLSVVEINRNLLRDLRSLYGERTVAGTDQDAEYVGVKRDPSSTVSKSWPGDDEMLRRYLDQQLESRVGPLLAALADVGVEATPLIEEGEDAAAAIIATLERLGTEVVCVGSRGKGMFDGLLGSTGTKLARRSPCPVLIIRP